MPRASTSIASSSKTTSFTEAPVRSLPFSEKAHVAKTGRSENIFEAVTAALSSVMSVIVSISIRSAPYFTASLTFSPNILKASSKDISPMGFISLPVGPISKAIKTSLSEFFSKSEAAFFAAYIAIFMRSS